MSLKFSKCKFIRQRIKFLGHFTPFGIAMDPSKLQAVHDFPTPRSKKDLQSFVGFYNFYRKFSDHHAGLISPLIDLLKKNRPWRFEEAEQQCFISGKTAFTEPFLSHPNYFMIFYLQTDAS